MEEQVDEKRERSTIQFPYADLDSAVKVAEAVFAIGGQRAPQEQLAARLGHESVKAGAFRVKLSTARTFGLIESKQQDAAGISLTKIGQQINDPKTSARARVEAFMAVPLYLKIYERFRGTMLPADEGLENIMVSLGVSSKQKDKARQAFQRSAQQAGLFPEGKGRLIVPATVSGATSHNEPEPEPPNQNGAGDDPLSTLHPFVRGLIESLPPPRAPWPASEREKWLKTAESVFGLMYEDAPQTRGERQQPLPVESQDDEPES